MSGDRSAGQWTDEIRAYVEQRLAAGDAAADIATLLSETYRWPLSTAAAFVDACDPDSPEGKRIREEQEMEENRAIVAQQEANNKMRWGIGLIAAGVVLSLGSYVVSKSGYYYIFTGLIAWGVFSAFSLLMPKRRRHFQSGNGSGEPAI